MSYKSITITPEDKKVLRSRFIKTDEVTPLTTDPKFFSQIVSLGIHQEIGTIHDELSTFLFDEQSGEKIPREHLRSELIEYNGYVGVRIWAEGHDFLDPRVVGLRTLLHPQFSFDSEKRITQLVLFPEIIIQIAAIEGAELVSVKPWGINTIFGGFDPTKSYYQGNMWEFINLDAIRYSRLLENRQIAFWGTHDLVSHIAGIKRTAWPELQSKGREARLLFEAYFAEAKQLVPFALVLPYALGMLLDDLAQPMNYESLSRRHVVELLMLSIKKRLIDPSSNAYLLKYPTAVEKLISIARSDDIELAKSQGEKILTELISELYSHSMSVASL